MTARLTMTVADVVRDYGFTSRHWTKLAAAGKVPGAWQPSGVRGAWSFDKAQFLKWREANQRKAPTWQPSIAGEKSTGRAPSVMVESSAEASKQRIDQLLKSVLGNGSTGSTRSHGATSRGGRSARQPRNSSVST